MKRREALMWGGFLATGLVPVTSAPARAGSAVTSSQAGTGNAKIDELWRLGAADLATLTLSGQVSSREVVQAHLNRIESVNGKVNAVVRLLGESALAQAADADRSLARGKPLGLLHGVPVSIKDAMDVAGDPTTYGLASALDDIPPRDSAEVKAIRVAGGIPFARTNAPDFLARWHTESSAYGATVNPWNANVTPGGSSGGEAAALATGMSPLGVGTDSGGSLRWPAQCAGIVSLKPTAGRIGTSSHFRGGGTVANQLWGVSGPMARSVRDVDLGYRVLAQPTAEDPRWTPVPLDAGATGEPVRVALVVDPGGSGVADSVAAGVRRAGKTLAKAGYEVEEVQPPAVQRAADVWAAIEIQELRSLAWQQFQDLALPDGARMMGNILEIVPELDFTDYMMAFTERHAIARQWSEFMVDYPLIVGPICTNPPFAVGADVASLESTQAIMRSMRFSVALSMLGLPVVVVPVGVQQGLPQAVQIIGRRFCEALCLQAAAAIEAQLGTITPIDPVQGTG